MKNIVEKHSLALRWFHWVNFPVLTLMIWSGLLIYWANDVYRLGWGDTTVLKFFPQSFYEALNIPFKLARGMSWHFVLMWIFFLNGLLYVLYTAFSGEWRYLLPNRHSFREAWQVTLYDLGLRKEHPPVRKFNGAQQIAYTLVVLMGVGSLLTGVAIYKPTQFGWLTALSGGYKSARVIHFVLTIGYVLFFIVHIAQVVRAGWNNFRAMVAGFELVEVPPPTQPAAAEVTVPATPNPPQA
ncbi:MAG: cytochrome b/b6 domain-containing protein [Hymenobacteraceae bacterium]|nr:cytochrome b/b6 domain-containing protein [Hymenobacteraceae bacterium]